MCDWHRVAAFVGLCKFIKKMMMRSTGKETGSGTLSTIFVEQIDGSCCNLIEETVALLFTDLIGVFSNVF